MLASTHIQKRTPLKPSFTEGLMIQHHKEDISVQGFAVTEYSLSLDAFLLPSFHVSKVAFLSTQTQLLPQWLCFSHLMHDTDT